MDLFQYFWNDFYSLLTITDFIFLILVAFLSGFIDSIAGGGGLLTVPALLSVGISPKLVLGTNKFQSSFGSFSSSLNYFKKSKWKIKTALLGIIFTAIGAFCGAFLVQKLSASWLKTILPLLLICMLIYMLFKPQLGKEEQKPKIKLNVFLIIFGLVLGFYDGFFGPGTGNFWVLALMSLAGMDMIKSTAYTKVFNFTSNIISLFTFLLGNNILILLGLIMGVAQFLGAKLGSNMVIKKGINFIRPIFILVVTALIIKLLFFS